MKAQFADSFFFIALLIESDDAHERAVQLVEELDHPLLTTTWIMAEVADALCAPSVRQSVASLLEFLENHSLISVIPADQSQFDAGVRLYASRKDKHWSLTDCISFEIMRRHGISEALTADRHFEQAGFQAVLKQP